MREIIKQQFQHLLECSMVQRIVLDDRGFIVESDDVIFPTGALRNKSATSWSHFLESIFHVLTGLPSGHDALSYEVESDIPFLSGLFAYSFRRETADGLSRIHWLICDLTHQLPELREQQQQVNEDEISRQKEENT